MANSTTLFGTSLLELLTKHNNKNGDEFSTKLLSISGKEMELVNTRNITLRNGEMSYCPAKKETFLTENGKWDRKNRQVGKYGKVLRKVIHENFGQYKIVPTEMEGLVNTLKASQIKDNFELVNGHDIELWYHNSRCGSDEVNSCMSHDVCAEEDFFEIYIQNTELIQMVILKDEDEMLIGRALLWDNLYLDRIYGEDSVKEKFKNFAKQNGFYHKREQNYSNKTEWICPDSGEVVELKITFDNVSTDFPNYPYVDTFSFMDDGILTNDYKFRKWRLDPMNGGYKVERPLRQQDKITNEWLDGDDVAYINSLDGYVSKESTVENIFHTYILKTDAQEIYGGGVASSKCHGITFCEEVNMLCRTDDLFYCTVSSTWYLRQNHTKVRMKNGEVANLANAPADMIETPTHVDLESDYYKMQRNLLMEMLREQADNIMDGGSFQVYYDRCSLESL